MSENKMFLTEINFDVKPYDIDAAGHVNNTVYVRWLEDLRIKLFDNFLPVNELLKNNHYLVVTSTTIKYKKQITLNDKPTGRIWLERLDRVIWVINSEISVNQSLVASAEQKCVVVDLITNKIQRPSAEIFEKFLQSK
jgi:acyl-CoA thioester hydrolase